MKWSRLKTEVDKYLAAFGENDVEIVYIDFGGHNTTIMRIDSDGLTISESLAKPLPKKPDDLDEKPSG